MGESYAKNDKALHLKSNYIEYSDPNIVLIESKTGFILRTNFIRMCKQRDIERNNEYKNEDIGLQFYLELDS